MGKQPINIQSSDHYYARRRPNIQKGFYKLFCSKYGVPVEKLIECLEEYRLKNQPSEIQPWSKNHTLNQCSENFDVFLKIVIEKTGIEVGEKVDRPERKKRGNDSYGDWFEESSMDGSFAYNNSSDDF